MAFTQTPQIDSYAALCSQVLQKPPNAGPWGTAWQTTMGGNMDTQLDRLYYARACRYPEETPTDALYYLANERGLERVLLVGTGGTLEDETAHRLRLKHAWTTWLLSGSAQGHTDEMSWCGFLTPVQTVRRHEWSTPLPVGSPYVQTFARQVWSQFDLYFRKPMPVDPLHWGDFTWGDGSTWGTTLTLPEIQLLRRLVREHKSAHDTCTYFWFIWTTGAVWGTYKWGDGTYWGATGNDTVGIVCGEKQWSTFGYM